MTDKVYKKLKRQNGERFARGLRDHHNGLLEIENLTDIVRYAGRNGEALLQYLMTLLPDPDAPAKTTKTINPFELLEHAGYKAFHANTLQKQNSIKKYFKPGELLCTFNDESRYKNYHIVHAVHKDANTLLREDFNGKEERQDPYGTSVISIQMLKKGGFISIKNRYNSTVKGCDNTFNSNPNNIIPGLSAALKAHFNVDFSASRIALPDGYVLMGNNIVHYHTEINNFYYGDQVWAKDNIVHAVDRGAGDALFDGFLYNHKKRQLKKIDPKLKDRFADDFNRAYGGNKDLKVDKDGNLTLNNTVLVGAKNSRIISLDLPALTTMGNWSLRYAPTKLTHFNAPSLTTMGNRCLDNAQALTHFNAPALTTMGNRCLHIASALTHFNAPALTTMGYWCLKKTPALKEAQIRYKNNNRK